MMKVEKVKKKRNSLYLASELDDRLKVQAKKERRKVNEICTIAIENYLKEKEND